MSVIIAGGSMAGATLALAISQLSHETLPVHLVEASEPETSRHPGFDARAIALVAGTCQQLMRIGVWQAITDCATAIKTVHISDHGHAGFATLDAQKYCISALGQVVELRDVGLRLFALLRRAPGVALHCPDHVTRVSYTQERVEMTLENGEIVTGHLLVTADSMRFALTTACGVDWLQRPYGQLAVIANVTTSVPHGGRAFKRSTQHGSLTMLLMFGDRCSLVWCHPLKQRDEVMALSDEQFCRELRTAFGWRLGHITQAGKRSAYPLSLTTVLKAIIHRIILVGNAAQASHPIVRQGFSLDLRDVMSLAETLTQAQNGAGDVGDYAVPARYQQRRERDRGTTISMTNNLVCLFANHWTPLVVGRNVGLVAMELFTLARDALAEWTLGWVTR